MYEFGIDDCIDEKYTSIAFHDHRIISVVTTRKRLKLGFVFNIILIQITNSIFRDRYLENRNSSKL